MQPDIAPGAERQGVAEPLVGKFVRDEPLRLPPVAKMVAAEDGQRLRLEGDFEVVVGHHHGVLRKRVWPKAADERAHHVRLAGQPGPRGTGQRGWARRTNCGHSCPTTGRAAAHTVPICTVARYVAMGSACS